MDGLRGEVAKEVASLILNACDSDMFTGPNTDLGILVPPRRSPKAVKMTTELVQLVVFATPMGKGKEIMETTSAR
eukprot:m.57177 g.57177  ORF g.57177 m.57177 type:complete len:75 (+) comp34691_c1_seq10:655-879(+)